MHHFFKQNKKKFNLLWKNPKKKNYFYFQILTFKWLLLNYIYKYITTSIYVHLKLTASQCLVYKLQSQKFSFQSNPWKLIYALLAPCQGRLFHPKLMQLHWRPLSLYNLLFPSSSWCVPRINHGLSHHSSIAFILLIELTSKVVTCMLFGSTCRKARKYFSAME